MIDEIDLKILNIIQNDARMSNASIARRLDMAPSGILERIRKLKKQGVIIDYITRINPEIVDAGLLAFVFIKTNEKRDRWDVSAILAEIPEVLEVHDIAGEDCYFVKLRTKDTDTLYNLLRDSLGTIPAIASTRTTIVLKTSKDSCELPLENLVIDSGK